MEDELEDLEDQVIVLEGIYEQLKDCSTKAQLEGVKFM